MNGGVIDDEKIESIAKKMQETIEKTVQLSAQDIKGKINARLLQMDEEEDKLIQALDSAKEARQAKISTITAIQKEVQQLQKVAEQKLKTQQ